MVAWHGYIVNRTTLDRMEVMMSRRPAQESPLELLSTRPTVSVIQAAQILSISKGQAYAMAHNGELRVVKIGTRLVIPTEQLRQLIAGAA